MKPDRIIVGNAVRRGAQAACASCYAPFNRNHDKLMFMDVRSAELTKYAANAMLATKISFMNEIANLAERLGADIEQVRLGIGSDPRIGYSLHLSRAAATAARASPRTCARWPAPPPRSASTPTLVRAVEAVNDRQKNVLFDKIAS